MNNFQKSLPIASLLLVVVLGACTSTKFSTVWKDETYEGPPGKILVINTFQNPGNRRLFEDDIVKSLKDLGVDAVMSYTVMPVPAVSDKGAIALLAKQLGADTVLINRPVGTRVEETAGFGSYNDVFLNTQTEVYDMKSNRLIFSSAAETWIREGVPYDIHIQYYVNQLVKKMSRQGLFRKKDVSS